MSLENIPETMTVAVLKEYSGPEAIHIEERPVPKAGKNEVLVKVAYSPINPSDLALLSGHYGFKDPTPVVPGGEGSGEVIDVGPGMMTRSFKGKKVACTGWGSGGGVWSQYVVKSVKGGVLSLNKDLSLEQGAMSMVNPLTACAFIEIAKKGKHKCIVLTAAASSLGQMVNRLGRNEGITIINVVRRDEQIDFLKSQGAEIVLNSSEEGFKEELKDVCEKHQTKLAFDAVAGELTNQLIKAMPRDSKVTVYSALSQQSIQAHPGSMIFENKMIDGFWLGPYLSNQSIFKTMRMWKHVKRQIPTFLKSEVRKTYPLSEVKEAIKDYQNQMTGGKVLLRMH